MPYENMAMFPSAGSRPSLSPNLDGPPPLPPLAGGPEMPGMVPQGLPAMALKGLSMMEEGSKILASVLPGISPVAVDAVAQLRASVPRALAELTTGSSASLPMGAVPTSAAMPPAPMMMAA